MAERKPNLLIYNPLSANRQAEIFTKEHGELLKNLGITAVSFADFTHALQKNPNPERLSPKYRLHAYEHVIVLGGDGTGFTVGREAVRISHRVGKVPPRLALLGYFGGESVGANMTGWIMKPEETFETFAQRSLEEITNGSVYSISINPGGILSNELPHDYRMIFGNNKQVVKGQIFLWHVEAGQVAEEILRGVEEVRAWMPAQPGREIAGIMRMVAAAIEKKDYVEIYVDGKNYTALDAAVIKKPFLQWAMYPVEHDKKEDENYLLSVAPHLIERGAVDSLVRLGIDVSWKILRKKFSTKFRKNLPYSVANGMSTEQIQGNEVELNMRSRRTLVVDSELYQNPNATVLTLRISLPYTGIINKRK